MNKPTKKTVEYYDYHQIVRYIENKYRTKNVDKFWHWILDVVEIRNGCFFVFPDNLVPEGVESEWGTSAPKFAIEFMDLIVKEFGEEILLEKIWVEW